MNNLFYIKESKKSILNIKSDEIIGFKKNYVLKRIKNMINLNIMEAIAFKDALNTNTYFNNQETYEYMALINNMIIIKAASIPQLFLFELAKEKYEALFLYCISLSCNSQINKIEEIDEHNIIIEFKSKEVYTINLQNTEEHRLSFSSSSISDYDLITIHETMKHSESKETSLYGFLSKGKRLYIVTQSGVAKAKKVLNISFIQEFDEPIDLLGYHHIQIKKIVYSFIYLGLRHSCIYRHFALDDNKSINAIKSILNKEWLIFFKLSPIVTYKLSNIDDDSLYSLTSDHQLYSAHCNKEYTLNMSEESIISIAKKSLTYSPLIKGIYHHESFLYLISDQMIEELNPYKNDSRTYHCDNNNKFIMGVSSCSSRHEGNHYELFLTTQSLFAINTPIHRSNSFGLFNYTLGSKKNGSIDEVTQQSQYSSNKSMTTISKTKKSNQCTNCNLKANYRCNKCYLYFSCTSPSIHLEEWKHHELHCPKMNYHLSFNKDDNYNKTKDHHSDSQLDSESKSKHDSQMNNSIQDNKETIDPKEFYNFFNSNYAMKRKEIITKLKLNKITAALSALNVTLSDNIQQITTNRTTNKIISFDLIDDKTLFTIEEILFSFQQYFEYFTNLLLLIHIYAKIQAKDKLWRTINYLNREMQLYNYNNAIELVIKHYTCLTPLACKRNIISKCEELFLGILKYSIALSKYSYCLGEFAYYEQFLFDFLEKMRKICHSNHYILGNMYLLLGNLYLKYNILKKAQMLYEAIIDKNNNHLIDLDSKLYQVVLCANYNLGIIYFTIGNYHLCKQCMEIAVKIKQDFLKERNDTQMAKIYLSLTEIEVEFSNYSSAYQYLQKASEAKDFALEIDEEFNKSFAIKESLLKEFIHQYANEDTVMNNEAKNNFMLKHFGVINNKGVNLQYKLIQDVIKDTPPKFNDEVGVRQFKQFFLFMTQLSKSQVKQLNDDQPKDLESNKRLPIVFSLEFKASLSQVQSLALSELQVISLTRVNILKNYLEKIKIKNLNYNSLYVSPQENNLTMIQNGYIAKSILQTWQVSPELKKELLVPQQSMVVPKKELPQKILEVKEIGSNRRKSLKSKEQKMLSNIFNESDMIDYDKLRMGIKLYCRENAPEKEQFVNEEFILLLGQEMKREELMKICTNQELIPILIDSFIKLQSDKSISTKAKKQRRGSTSITPNLKSSPYNDDDNDGYRKNSK